MELAQRFVLVWTLIVSCGVVLTNGDIIGSPGDIRQGYRVLQAAAEVDTNTEEPKSAGRYKANNIIVQPVQEADSKVLNRQMDPSLASRPAKDEGLKSDDSKANGVVALNRDTKVSNPQVSAPKNPEEKKGDTQDSKSENAPKNLAIQTAGQRKPKHVSPQSIPVQNVVVQPIYQQSNPRLGNPRSGSSSNVAIPPGSNFAVESSYQQQNIGENLQSTPMKKTQPRYGFYIARAQPSPPNHVAVHSGPVENSLTDYRPLKPSHVVPVQRGWNQDSYYSNPRSNFPMRTIAIQQQPQNEQNAWVGIPVQAPHVQPVYVQNSNLGITEIDASKDDRPRHGQAYWYGFSQSNPLRNLPVQPAYDGSSAFSHPGYEPTRTIAIQPAYDPDLGILKVNPPVNIEVQPKYQTSSPAGISRPNPPNNPPEQSAIQQNHQITNPRPNPIPNVPAQPTNEPNPGARLSPGYPTINISFLRGYETPNLRTEQPQSIPSGAAVQPATIVPSQPATNPVVQPIQETLHRKQGIPQPDAPKEAGSHFVQQEVPKRFPAEFLESSHSWEGSPSLATNSHGNVPINSKLPTQSPSNPAVQPTRGNVYSREGNPQPVAPIEFGEGFVPYQQAPFYFPTDLLEKPEYQQASPLVASSQGYVPINSELPAQSPSNPAVQPTRGNVNSRQGIPQPVAPIEFGEGFVPYQQAPIFFPTDLLETPDYQQDSPLVASSQGYVPINSELPAQSPPNPAVQPTRGNVNSRQGVPHPVPPIEFGEDFVPHQQAPIFFPPELLETPDYYEQASPLVASSRGYVSTGREIPTDQRSISSHPLTQAARKIALQSGHAKPILKVIATKTNPPREVLVQSGYGQLHCHLKFVPRGSFALNVPKNSTLESEIQRNKDLHQLVVSQLHSMHKQPHVPHPQETNFGKFGLFPSQSAGQNPHGGKGSKKKKNGWGISPLFLRSSNPPLCTGRNQFPRSLNSENEPNGGHGKPVWNYPETSSVGLEKIGQAVNSIIPKVNATLNSFINSTLNGIRPQQEQGNGTNLMTGITTGIVDAAKTLEKKVSDVISPILGSQINGDPQKNPNNSQNPQNANQGAHDQGFPPVPTISNPNDMAKFVNEYGRNVMDALPSSFNSAVDNSNAYLKDFYDNLKGYVH